MIDIIKEKLRRYEATNTLEEANAIVPIGSPEAAKPKRFGFLQGTFKIPADFDNIANEEIASLFSNPS